MTVDTNRIDDATLALLSLGLHEASAPGNRSTGMPLTDCHAKGLIENPVGRARSVVFTDEGLRTLQDLLGALGLAPAKLKRYNAARTMTG